MLCQLFLKTGKKFTKILLGLYCKKHHRFGLKRTGIIPFRMKRGCRAPDVYRYESGLESYSATTIGHLYGKRTMIQKLEAKATQKHLQGDLLSKQGIFFFPCGTKGNQEMCLPRLQHCNASMTAVLLVFPFK